MNDRHANERRQLKEALEAAGLEPSKLSVEIGRSKDYIGDFLRGSKDSIGRRESAAIEAAIAAKASHPKGLIASKDDTDPPNDSECIRISLEDFRAEALATLRVLRIPPILAREQIDDLIGVLRELSKAGAGRSLGASLHIVLGSGDRLDEASGDPNAEK